MKKSDFPIINKLSVIKSILKKINSSYRSLIRHYILYELGDIYHRKFFKSDEYLFIGFS